MTKEEINSFIKEMRMLGEDWDPRQVEAEFGNLSLEEAVERSKAINKGYGRLFNKIFNIKK